MIRNYWEMELNRRLDEEDIIELTINAFKASLYPVPSGYRVVYVGSFLGCVDYIKENDDLCLYGPSGGIVSLVEEALVMESTGECITFSCEEYLGTWRVLRYGS